MEVLNVPPEDVLSQASRRRLFFDSRGNPRCITNSKNRKRKPGTKPLAQVLRCNDPLFVDFVSKCLEWVWKQTVQFCFIPYQLNENEKNQFLISSSYLFHVVRSGYFFFFVAVVLDGTRKNEWHQRKLSITNGCSPAQIRPTIIIK